MGNFRPSVRGKRDKEEVESVNFCIGFICVSSCSQPFKVVSRLSGKTSLASSSWYIQTPTWTSNKILKPVSFTLAVRQWLKSQAGVPVEICKSPEVRERDALTLFSLDVEPACCPHWLSSADSWVFGTCTNHNQSMFSFLRVWHFGKNTKATIMATNDVT